MHRKVVTVLFCDVVGSTALGESVDPEALQGLLARYFERMKAIVESHEGSVEKFIGDAVMAVFGVPAVHEDDALRACRAAVEMRAAFPELGVQGRIGVNSGEVVTGAEERLATGDAVNVAARLQQAAQPDEVLVGAATLELVSGAIEAEPIEPLALKGKSQTVPAFRLVGVLARPERSHESLFVGRDRELALIREAWERAQAEQRCELVTILGDPGIGKSRLVAEALASVDVRSVRGRCLPYGEGITYWPVVEVVKQLDVLPSDPAAAASISSLLGETEGGTSAEEIAWAFRKLLVESAPIVAVFDDIQWGEETFLDLVEGVALLSSGAPILLICSARPELLERRSQWPVTVRLEPLSGDKVDQLIGKQISDDLRGRIADAAGGNPLFIGEMLAMTEEAGAEVAVPPTMRALLAARLDRLDGAERRVLERGAVEGEIFHLGAVQALAPEESQVIPRLAALVRRELIRSDTPQFPGEDGFRFRHLLIRDAAYDALTKATRAELHERFGVWLEERGTDLVEVDEILGYHLEQAARYKAELGQLDPTLAERAGERLAAAGRRALWRGDVRAAAELLERALVLLRPVRVAVALELDLAHAQPTNRESIQVVEAAAERALACGDRPGEAAARVMAAAYGFAADETESRAATALPLLEQAEDHASLVHVWWAIGFHVANERWQYEDTARAAEEALRHARLAGQPAGYLFALDMALVYGPRPADEALRALDAVLPDLPDPRALAHRAWLLAMLGRFEEAWRIGREAGERLSELSAVIQGEPQLAEIATLAGDHGAAAGYLRSFCERLEERGERPQLSTYESRLGRSFCALGRYDEAEESARLGRELGDGQDVATQAWWRQTQALVLAHRGRYAEAEALAREAVAIVEPTDALNFQGYALSDLAEVLAAAGRTEEACAVLEQALDRYERKQNLAMVAQVQPRLEALRTRKAI